MSPGTQSPVGLPLLAKQLEDVDIERQGRGERHVVQRRVTANWRSGGDQLGRIQRDQPCDGRISVIHSHGMTSPHISQELAQSSLQLGHSRPVHHDQKMTMNDHYVKQGSDTGMGCPCYLPARGHRHVNERKGP